MQYSIYNTICIENTTMYIGTVAQSTLELQCCIY